MVDDEEEEEEEEEDAGAATAAAVAAAAAGGGREEEGREGLEGKRRPRPLIEETQSTAPREAQEEGEEEGGLDVRTIV